MEDDQELRDLVAAPLLDAVYVETKELKQVVAIQPKPALGSESVRESVCLWASEQKSESRWE